ncbi:hypothetical protein [Archangium lansingense]|uniref:Uncharacterized protein n=1 Tax=Archangium lansingense TaxID=2995310 RepID=A0ABT4A216_9BACT|nr:hypothetical protein [Archangium lansinium]MCY1075691.1 hypothetical protein [Archangium lansinium]
MIDELPEERKTRGDGLVVHIGGGITAVHRSANGAKLEELVANHRVVWREGRQPLEKPPEAPPRVKLRLGRIDTA